MKVRYLPYPPLQRVEYHCPDCPIIVVVFTHYAEAYAAIVTHRCAKTKRERRLERR